MDRMLKEIIFLETLGKFMDVDFRLSGGNPTDVGRRGEISVDAVLAGGNRGPTISPGRRKNKKTI